MLERGGSWWKLKALPGYGAVHVQIRGRCCTRTVGEPGINYSIRVGCAEFCLMPHLGVLAGEESGVPI